MSRRTVDDWRREVFRSTAIKDNTRVLLLWLADRMRADRTVSVPRAEMTVALNRSERRIAERIAAAHEAGFLSTVAKGRVKRTAVYQGLFPDAESMTDGRTLSTEKRVTISSTLKVAAGRTLSERESVTDVGHAITRADLSAVGHDRDVSNEEGCRFHGWTACPEDCADHPSTREESA